MSIPSQEELNNSWHTPQTAIIKPGELQVHFNWPGSEFINISAENVAALLAGSVVVVFRDFDDTIYLRLAPRNEDAK